MLLSALSAAPAANPVTRPAAHPPAAPNAPAAVNAPAGAEREIDRAPLPPVGEVRELEGDARNEAIRLRDAADLARAAFEKRYRPPKFPPESDADFEDVVAAYREVINRFPGSELDCYCRICLSGAYLYRGKRPQALDEAKQAAEVFAGTRPGFEAAFTVARFYLNPFRDADRTATWLLRVSEAMPQVKDASERQKLAASFQQLQSDLAALRREQAGKKPQ